MSEEIKTALFRVVPFALILIILFIVTKRKKLDATALAIVQPLNWNSYFYWIIGFLIFCLGIEFSFYHIGILEIDPWNHAFYPSLIRIVGAVILAPLAEELIFRGLLLFKLNKRLNNIHIANLIQAIFFVLLHNFTYQNTFISNLGIAQSFIDAMLFGYARYYTKSIFTSMTMHITGNFIALAERFIL